MGNGELLWQTNLDASYIASATSLDGLVVIAGGVMGRGIGRSTRPMFVAAVDPVTREPVWRREVREVFAADGGPIIVRPDGRRLAALEPATGTVLWTHDLEESAFALERGALLAIVSPDDIEVVDRVRGTAMRSIERPAEADGRVALRGTLLTMWSSAGVDPSTRERSDLWVLDVSRPDTPWRSYPGANGIVALEDGIVIATQRDRFLQFHRLDGQGRQRWLRAITLPDRSCCWTVQPAADPRGFVVVPPSPARQPIRVLEEGDGSTRASFRLSSGMEGADGMRWIGPVAMAFDGQRTMLAGPAGEVQLPGRVAVVSDQDPLLVVTGEGLVAIDERQVSD